MPHYNIEQCYAFLDENPLDGTMEEMKAHFSSCKKCAEILALAKDDNNIFSKASPEDKPEDIGSLPPNHPNAPEIPDYSLIEIIGDGSFGTVWKGKTRLGRECAIKILDKNTKVSEKELSGLRRMEMNRGAISHHGLVQILHVGKTERFWYYAMELVDDTLENRIKRKNGKVFTPDEACKIIKDLLEVLKYCHGMGFAHRDIKPANIGFKDGVMKLLDLGLVTSSNRTDRTTIGTPDFMPARPGLTPDLDDLYAAGMILYCLTTGKDPKYFPSLPKKSSSSKAFVALHKIILKACHPTPAKRFTSSEKFCSELIKSTTNDVRKNNHERINKKKDKNQTLKKELSMNSMKDKILETVKFMQANGCKVSPNLLTEIEALSKNNYRAVLMGQFKVGKSMLINKVFFKDSILFTDVLEATSIPTEIVYGAEKILEITPYVKRIEKMFTTNENGETEEKEVETIDGTIGKPKIIKNPTTEDIRKATTAETPEGREELAKSIASVKLYWPCDSFRTQSFIDTPGINSGNPAVVNTTYGIIPKSDVVIYMVTARGLSQTDEEFLQSKIFEQGVTRVMMLVSYAPNVQVMDAAQCEKILNQIKARLSAIGRAYIPVNMISLDFNDPTISNSLPHSAESIQRLISDFVEKNLEKGRIERIACQILSALRTAILYAKTERQAIGMMEKERAQSLFKLKAEKKALKQKYDQLCTVFLCDFKTAENSFGKKVDVGLVKICNEYKSKVGKASDTDEVRNILISAEAELRPSIDDLFFIEGEVFKRDLRKASEKFSSDFSDEIEKMQLHTIISVDGGFITRIPAVILKIADYIILEGPLPGGFLLSMLLRWILGKIPWIKDIMPYRLVTRFVVGHVQSKIDEQFSEMRSEVSLRLSEAYHNASAKLKDGFETYMDEELQPIIDALNKQADPEPQKRRAKIDVFIPKAESYSTELESTII